MEESMRLDTAVSPPIIQVHNDSSKRLPLWMLLAFSLGFLLPVCSCGFLGLTFFAGLSLATGEAATTGGGDAVAIVRVAGTITSSDSTEFSSEASSGVIIADLQQAAADPTVKAIVLRVDSPGGSVTGSAQIYEAVKALSKPVVVSMAGTAASGGYYISAPADYIFARPDTVTGSIGVIMTLFNAQELIDELGVEVIALTSGPNKGLGNLWETMTAEQQVILETVVAESYQDFLQVVVAGRGLSLAAVQALADGRIYTGRQALDNGLVDELGDLDAAVTKAAQLGGISGEVRRVEYDHLPTFNQVWRSMSSRLGQTEATEMQQLIREMTLPRIEYRYAGPVSP